MEKNKTKKKKTEGSAQRLWRNEINKRGTERAHAIGNFYYFSLAIYWKSKREWIESLRQHFPKFIICIFAFAGCSYSDHRFRNIFTP